MVTQFANRRGELQEILSVIKDCPDEDFYVTENNQRVYVDNEGVLKRLLKESHHVFILNDYEWDKKGIVLVWKSVGGDTTRNYVKLVANCQEAADALLTMLCWNFGKEMFVKLRKDSKLLYAFRKKGFNFEADRGAQLLLKRRQFFVANGVNNVIQHDKD